MNDQRGRVYGATLLLCGNTVIPFWSFETQQKHSERSLSMIDSFVVKKPGLSNSKDSDPSSMFHIVPSTHHERFRGYCLIEAAGCIRSRRCLSGVNRRQVLSRTCSVFPRVFPNQPCAEGHFIPQNSSPHTSQHSHGPRMVPKDSRRIA
jgi:hypothetical protein